MIKPKFKIGDVVILKDNRDEFIQGKVIGAVFIEKQKEWCYVLQEGYHTFNTRMESKIINKI